MDILYAIWVVFYPSNFPWNILLLLLTFTYFNKIQKTMIWIVLSWMASQLLYIGFSHAQREKSHDLWTPSRGHFLSMGVPFPPEQMIDEEGSYLLDKQLPWNPKKQSYILSLGSIPSHSKSYAQVHGEFNYCQVNHGQPRIPVSKKDLWRAHAILKWADESR